MKTSEPLRAVAALVLFSGCFACAASLETETFTGGLDGWTNNVDASKWSVTNQSARVSFASGLVPKSASLEAGPGATGGAFSGGYDGAGVEAIGFSFLAEDTQPSFLKIEITGGTNIFFQDLQPRMAAPGLWNLFLCPLTGPDAARWNGAPLAELPEALSHITRVAIRISSSGAAAQSYRLDDIFLDRLPLASALTPDVGGVTKVSWTNLRAGFTYDMQAATSPDSVWSRIATLPSSNSFAILTHTNPAPDTPTFYQLLVR